MLVKARRCSPGFLLWSAMLWAAAARAEAAREKKPAPRRRPRPECAAVAILEDYSRP
jgi:hypothetical protein